MRKEVGQHVEGVSQANGSIVIPVAGISAGSVVRVPEQILEIKDRIHYVVITVAVTVTPHKRRRRKYCDLLISVYVVKERDQAVGPFDSEIDGIGSSQAKVNGDLALTEVIAPCAPLAAEARRVLKLPFTPPGHP